VAAAYKAPNPEIIRKDEDAIVQTSFRKGRKSAV
jgi:hypothetical protein